MRTATVEMHDECVELVSGDFRLAVTTKVGPRVIGGFIAGSPNIFRVMPDEPLPDCPTGFRLYGGHRLWHSPEAMPRSYAADNGPVKVVEHSDGSIEFNSGVEELTGIEKSITIRPLVGGRFEVIHRLVNRSVWPVEMAPWALSVMAPGGMAVLPLLRDPAANRFAPDRFVIAWPYTDLDDPRLTLGKEFILLRQDPAAAGPCKVGLNGEAGWIAYVNAGTALVKHFTHFADAEYPDGGCSIESYSCADFCEIETVAPLYLIDPDDEVTHVELWQGVSGLPQISAEQEVKTHLLPRLAD